MQYDKKQRKINLIHCIKLTETLAQNVKDGKKYLRVSARIIPALAHFFLQARAKPLTSKMLL